MHIKGTRGYARLSAPPLVLAVPTVLKQNEGINSTASDNDGWKIERTGARRESYYLQLPLAVRRLALAAARGDTV